MYVGILSGVNGVNVMFLAWQNLQKHDLKTEHLSFLTIKITETSNVHGIILQFYMAIDKLSYHSEVITNAVTAIEKWIHPPIDCSL